MIHLHDRLVHLLDPADFAGEFFRQTGKARLVDLDAVALHLRDHRPAKGEKGEEAGGGGQQAPATKHGGAFGDNGVEIQARCG